MQADAARRIEDLSDTSWFNVGDDDYVPEEFASFFGLYGARRKTFVAHMPTCLMSLSGTRPRPVWLPGK